MLLMLSDNRAYSMIDNETNNIISKFFSYNL
jgi:hypothetical protein